MESEEHYCPSYILDAFAFLRMTVSTSICGSEVLRYSKKKKESPTGQGLPGVPLSELVRESMNRERERLIKKNLKKILKFFRDFENG
jgi:hypothetical protein